MIKHIGLPLRIQISIHLALLLSWLIVLCGPAQAQELNQSQAPIKFGVVALEPFHISAPSGPKGWFTEATYEIIEQSGLQASMTYLPLGRIFQSLRTGQIDAALVVILQKNNIPNTTSLATVYPNIRMGIIAPQQPPINKLTYFKDRTISVPSIKAIATIQDRLPQANFQQVQSYEKAYDLIHLKRIDGVFGLEIALQHFAATHSPDTTLYFYPFITGSANLLHSTQSKHTIEAWAAIDEAISALKKDGIFQDLVQKYMNQQQDLAAN